MSDSDSATAYALVSDCITVTKWLIELGDVAKDAAREISPRPAQLSEIGTNILKLLQSVEYMLQYVEPKDSSYVESLLQSSHQALDRLKTSCMNACGPDRNNPGRLKWSSIADRFFALNKDPNDLEINLQNLLRLKRFGFSLDETLLSHLKSLIDEWNKIRYNSDELGAMTSSEDEFWRGYESDTEDYFTEEFLFDAVSFAVSNGNVASVEECLAKDLKTVAQGNYQWLQDLVDCGYNLNEIAHLLVDTNVSAPWMYLEHGTDLLADRKMVLVDHHKADCIHRWKRDSDIDEATQLRARRFVQYVVSSPRESLSILEKFEHRNRIRQSVEELCGLAGVVPRTRDTSNWDGLAVFGRKTTVTVTYQTGHLPLLTRLRSILRRLLQAFAILQHDGVCCNTFSILRLLPETTMSQPTIDLQSIDTTFMLDLDALLQQENPDMSKLDIAARRVLATISPFDRSADQSAASGTILWTNTVLHNVSLALQVLSLGLLSFCYAHAAPFNPNFLVDALHLIRLTGSKAPETINAEIFAESRSLTCLEGLMKGKVLVFRTWHASSAVLSDLAVESATPQQRHDMMASPADLLDICGPASLITSSRAMLSDGVSCIKIGGGTLKAQAQDPDVLHWTVSDADDTDEMVSNLETCAAPFDPFTKARIGMLQVNTECMSQQESQRAVERFEANLMDVGTSNSHFAIKSFTRGMAGGQYAVINFSQTLELRPGVTVKECILNDAEDLEIDHSDLDAYFGLQFSLCTGLARRTTLRKLLADGLLSYTRKRSSHGLSEAYVEQLRDAMHGEDFNNEWLNVLANSDKDKADSVKRLLRDMLRLLKGTGFDEEDSFVVSWVLPERPRACFKIEIKDSNYWLRMLQDSDHTATFASITLDCFETDDITCNCRPRRQAHLPAHGHSDRFSQLPFFEVQQMETDVYRSLTSVDAENRPFKLENNKKYWIGPSDSLLKATISLSDKGDRALHISKSILPEGVARRVAKAIELRRIPILKERGRASGSCTPVLVLTPKAEKSSMLGNRLPLDSSMIQRRLKAVFECV